MYRSLNDELREKFGEKVYKIALEGGFTCPNRDGTLGTKGCIFCLGGSGDFAEKPCDCVFEQIEKGKNRVAHKNPSGMPFGRGGGTSFGTQQNKTGMGGTGAPDYPRKNSGIYPPGISAFGFRFRSKSP